MASFNEKRTHWFMGRNKWGQRLRLCNGYATGIFVTNNNPDSKRQVDCTVCKRTLDNPKLIVKQIRYQTALVSGTFPSPLSV